MKKFILILGMILFTVGCGKEETLVIDMDQAVARLDSYEEFASCHKASEDDLETIYDFDLSLLEEYRIMMPQLANKANMYMILKVKKENQDEVRNMLNNFTEKYIEQFKLYAPDEADLINNKVISIKGDYILYVVSDDNSKTLKEIMNK